MAEDERGSESAAALSHSDVHLRGLSGGGNSDEKPSRTDSGAKGPSHASHPRPAADHGAHVHFTSEVERGTVNTDSNGARANAAATVGPSVSGPGPSTPAAVQTPPKRQNRPGVSSIAGSSTFSVLRTPASVVAQRYDMLIRQQREMLVLEFRREDTSARFRYMRRFEILEEAREVQNLPHLNKDSPELRQMSSLFDTHQTPFEGEEGGRVHDVFLSAPVVPLHQATGSMESPYFDDYSRLRHNSSDNPSSNHRSYKSALRSGDGLGQDTEDAGFPLPRPGGSRGRSVSVHDITRKHREAMSSVGGILQARDLRIIDPSFPASRHAAFLVRRYCILVNIKPVKAILMPGKVLFFPEEGADGDLEVVMNALRSPPEDVDMPFEFKALEAFLMTVTASLSKSVDDIAPIVSRLVASLSKGRALAGEFAELKRVRDLIAQSRFHAKGVRKVLSDVLDSAPNLRMMRWSLINLVGSAQLASEPVDDAGAAGPVSTPLPAVRSGMGLSGSASADSSAVPSSINSPADVSRQVGAGPQSRKATTGPPPTNASGSATTASGHDTGTDTDTGTGPGSRAVAGAGAPAAPYKNPEVSSESRPPSSASPEGPSCGLAPVTDGKGNEDHKQDENEDAPRAIIAGLPLHSDAIELLLESYLMEIETTLRRLNEERAKLNDAEHQLSLFLNTSRNLMLKMDIFVSVITMCLSAAAVVAGFFGMNLANGHEVDVDGAGFDDSRRWFNGVVSITAAAVVVASTTFLGFLTRYLK